MWNQWQQIGNTPSFIVSSSLLCQQIPRRLNSLGILSILGTILGDVSRDRMETKTLHWWSGRAGETEGPPSLSPSPSPFNTDAHAEKPILQICASHSTKTATGAGVMGTGPILYTILRHYARCQSAKSAEALQPWPLTQELNGRGKVIRVLGFFVLKAWHLGVGVAAATALHLLGRNSTGSERQKERIKLRVCTWAPWQIPSHQCFWSHGPGEGANSAQLFTLLISGVVTSRGTHTLTSGGQASLRRAKRKKKRKIK